MPGAGTDLSPGISTLELVHARTQRPRHGGLTAPRHSFSSAGRASAQPPAPETAAKQQQQVQGALALPAQGRTSFMQAPPQLQEDHTSSRAQRRSAHTARYICRPPSGQQEPQTLSSVLCPLHRSTTLAARPSSAQAQVLLRVLVSLGRRPGGTCVIASSCSFLVSLTRSPSHRT